MAERQKSIFLFSGRKKIFKEDEWRTPNTYCRNFKSAPASSGVYLLVTFALITMKTPKGQIVYIGSSKNLAARLRSHEVIEKLQKAGHYVRFYFKECADFIDEEKRLIRSIRPKFNIIHNGEEIH